ncbi:copia protein [Trifolium pratense]|uniref:Copia protein n=1 Tax=Trifolium pratense TaxID=57577 RepID=A0A2K3PAL9_TRIPR|nr:copia protein [Trifolium pratense]
MAKYEARLVTKGFLQRHGLDFDQVFAPVARIETVRLVVAMTSDKGWSMYQFDVKSAFLDGSSEEEVYMKHLEPETRELTASSCSRILRSEKMNIVSMSKGFGILYPRSSPNSEAELIGYTDADWCVDKDDWKNTTDHVFMLENSPISCLPSLMVNNTNGGIEKMNLKEDKPLKMLIDKSTIDLAEHPIAHGRSKHLETRFHFLRGVNKGKLELEQCKSDEQTADILTKPLKRLKFQETRDKLGVVVVTYEMGRDCLP